MQHLDCHAKMSDLLRYAGVLLDQRVKWKTYSLYAPIVTNLRA